ncbi:MAG: FecR domain-containing protein, partial [Pseudomonadota bacterium]
TLSAFLTWLDASEEHRAAWAHLERTRAVAIEASSETDELLPADADKQQWSSDQNSLPTDPSASSAMSSRSMAMASAGAFAILLTVYAAWPSIMETLRADHVAGTGEMKRVTLKDGSVATLGARSSIAINFSTHTRSVELLRGVAFFDIRHDPKRPFLARFGGVEARVLGTSFEFRRLNDAAIVGVSEGKVEVSSSIARAQSATDKGNRIQLNAGESASIDSTGKKSPVVHRENLEGVASWLRGELTVKNWLVEDVIDVLRRHYPGVIFVEPWRLSKVRITGVYSLKEPVDSLKLIAATQGLKVRQVSPWFTTISKY